MTDRPPQFDEIVEAGDPDRGRLESVHAMLTAAGPPPELPPSLGSAPPEPRAAIFTLRRRNTAITAVAIAATVLFGLGFAIGGRDSPSKPVKTIAMTGPAGTAATIALEPVDAAGNWPMILNVKGLPPLPEGKTYALWLTRAGKLADPCGTFVAGPETSSVPLNAPYRLKDYDGWVVVRTGSTGPFLLRTATV